MVLQYLGSHIFPALTDAAQEDDDDTASEEESDEDSEEEEQGDDGSESDEDTEHAVNARKKLKVDADVLKSAKQSAGLDLESSDDEDEDEDDEDEDDEDEEDSSEEKVVDLSTEKELANRVLEKVLASAKAEEAQPDNNLELEVKQIAKQKVLAKDIKAPVKETKTSEIRGPVKEVKKPEIAEPSKKSKRDEPVVETSEEDSLTRTVFVRNLPLESKVPDLRRQFSEFGEVKSFRLVLHPITK